MREEVFNDVYPHYLCDYTNGETLETLRIRWNYSDREALRCDFKNERKRRHIPSKNEQGEQKSFVRTNSNNPRVGIVDIETLPLVSMTFGIWQQNIGLEQIISDICMLSWAGKFLNESEVYSDILTQRETKTRDTKRIAQSCWDFLSKCDIVVGHNFSSFDRTHINNEFLKHDLPPLKYIVVDTLSVAKKNFSFTSNKMQFINDKFGLTSKMENDGFPLWRKCSEGDQESLDIMESYNRKDISATEDLFYKMRPYINNFNVALYNEIDTKVCPVCGCEELSEEGFYFTSSGKWISYRCLNCKSISRGKENLLSKDKKKSLLINS